MTNAISHNSRRSLGFTLIELMIAIALVLVLMIGVAKVFTVTSDTIGASQQLSAGVRDNRAAQSILYHDFSSVALSTPLMMIRSRTMPAFRNRADELADHDFAGNPVPASILTTDTGGDNVDGNQAGEVISPADYDNFRNHRLDTVGFFAQDLFHRQTGDTGTLVDTGTLTSSSYEAWIWYGHLWQPDNSGTFTANTLPGAGTFSTNPNNVYSSQWLLGRVVTLMRDPAGFSAASPQPQYYGMAAGTALSPIGVNSTSAGGTVIFSSRYDLAGASIDQFRTQWFATTPSGNWWDSLDQFTTAVTYNGATIPAGTPFLYQAKPFIDRPLTSAGASQTVPVFMSGVSQFIVEYAGDYLFQDTNPASPTYGTATASFMTNGNITDGQIDFTVDPTSNTRSIRWYGLPRDTNGDGQIIGYSSGKTARDIQDVVPLRDLIATTNANALAGKGAAWERNIDTELPINEGTNYKANMSSADMYTNVWGPTDKKPTMIRITLVIDDPLGRLNSGQTFEYVFTLPKTLP